MANTELEQSASPWVWMCPVISLSLAVSVGYFFGLSWRTAVLIGMALACLVTAVGAYLFGGRPLPLPLGPAPATRGTNFNWLAPWYDQWCSVFGFGRRFRDWTLVLAKFMPGDHVLDVGCGNGVLTHRIADLVGPAGAVWGIDPAPDMIRAAMLRRSRTANVAQFKLGAIETLPFEDASFDVVFISLVLHHLPVEVKAAGLREVWRVLKPGGRLLVVEPDRPDHRLWRTALWPGRLYKRLKDHLEGRTAQILQQAGFESVATLGRWHHVVSFWRAERPS